MERYFPPHRIFIHSNDSYISRISWLSRFCFKPLQEMTGIHFSIKYDFIECKFIISSIIKAISKYIESFLTYKLTVTCYTNLNRNLLIWISTLTCPIRWSIPHSRVDIQLCVFSRAHWDYPTARCCSCNAHMDTGNDPSVIWSKSAWNWTMTL